MKLAIFPLVMKRESIKMIKDFVETLVDDIDTERKYRRVLEHWFKHPVSQTLTYIQRKR